MRSWVCSAVALHMPKCQFEEVHVVTDIGLTGMGFTIIWLESIVALVFVLLYLPGDRPTPFHEAIGLVKVWRCRAGEFRARRESPVGLGCDRGREGWLSMGELTFAAIWGRIRVEIGRY